MDRLQTRLSVLEVQLADAAGRVERQRDIVEQMRDAGWDARLAESMLRTMERTLWVMRREMDTQRREVLAWRSGFGSRHH
jgi:type I site-specific restriction endonuclease